MTQDFETEINSLNNEELLFFESLLLSSGLAEQSNSILRWKMITDSKFDQYALRSRSPAWQMYPYRGTFLCQLTFAKVIADLYSTRLTYMSWTCFMIKAPWIDVMSTLLAGISVLLDVYRLYLSIIPINPISLNVKLVNYNDPNDIISFLSLSDDPNNRDSADLLITGDFINISDIWITNPIFIPNPWVPAIPVPVANYYAGLLELFGVDFKWPYPLYLRDEGFEIFIDPPYEQGPGAYMDPNLLKNERYPMINMEYNDSSGEIRVFSETIGWAIVPVEVMCFGNPFLYDSSSFLPPDNPLLPPKIEMRFVRNSGIILVGEKPDIERKFSITNRSANTVILLDPVTSQIEWELPVGASPWYTSFNSKGNLLGVVNYQSSDFSMIDVIQGTLLYSTPVGGQPVAFSFAPDGKRAYVACRTGEISVVDLLKKKTTQHIPIINEVGGTSVEGIDITPDGKKAIITVRNGTGPGKQCGFLVIMDIWKISPYKKSDTYHQILDIINLPDPADEPGYVSITNDGDYAYILHSGTDVPGVAKDASAIVVFDLENNYVDHTITPLITQTPDVGYSHPKVEIDRTKGIGLPPSGNRAYLCFSDTGNVGVLDIRKQEFVAATENLGKTIFPMQVAISQDNQLVCVTNWNDDSITVIDDEKVADALENFGLDYFRTHPLPQVTYFNIRNSQIKNPQGIDNKPILSFLMPNPGDVLKGKFTAVVKCEIPNEIKEVTFNVNESCYGFYKYHENGHFKCEISTDSFSDGMITLNAKGETKNGREIEETIYISVDNTPPSLTINSPQDNNVVSGEFLFSVKAEDDFGIKEVKLNNEIIDDEEPFEIMIDSTRYKNGQKITLNVIAEDAAGNITEDNVHVFVDNSF